MKKKNNFGSEFKLHKLTQRNLKNLFNLEFIASEIQLNKLRIDNLAFDEKINAFVIIEYKNVLDLNAANQAQKYLDLVKDNPEYFTNRLDNRHDIDFENTRVMIIAPEFSESQINDSNNDFELWKVSKYENKVTYENMKTNEIKCLRIEPGELKSTEEKTLSEVSKESSELYLNFKQKVLNLFNDVDLMFLVKAVSFRANNQIACIFRLEKPAKIHYYADELNDDENKARCISDITTGGKANYELILNSKDETDYALYLFKQVYLEKGGKND